MFFTRKNQKTLADKKIVMAFGTFDLLHAGHENFLRQAKEQGDHLIVIVARDNTVQSVKGRSAINNEKTRVKNLRQTEWANQVELGNVRDKYKIILKHKPHLIALGYDQFVFTQALAKFVIDNNLNTEIIRTDAYYPQVYKSSLLRAEKEKVETNSTRIKTIEPSVHYN